jgi:hypothetical protein
MFKMHSDEFEKELKDFKRELYQHFQNLFDINTLIFSQLSKIIEENVNGLELKSDFQRTINFLFCRSYRLHWSILILCENGFGPEAGILLRSLMEQGVNMAWIGKENPDQRAKLFVDYLHIARKKLYDNWEKHRVFHNLTNTQKQFIEDKSEIEKLYLEVKENYKDESRWAPKHIKTRAEEVGLVYDWDFYYWNLSFFGHSNSASQFEFIRKLGENDLYVVGPSESMIKDVLHLSCKYLLLAFDLWNKTFELGYDKQVQEFLSKLTEISFIRETK